MSHSKQPAAESFALALMVLAFAACNSGNDSSDEKVSTKQFPIDSAVSASIKSKGVPGDIADFLAASKLDTSRIDAHTVKAVRTYPNGATREITFRLTPGIKYTPTAAESARVAGGGAAIYDVKYSLDTSNGAYVLKLDYFVPDSGLPAGLGKRAATASETQGSGGHWEEVAHRGAEVNISSILEYGAEHHLPGGHAVSGVFEIASAANSVSGALQLERE